jgi:hypothetical protein
LFNALEDRNIEARFTYEPGELEVIAHLSIPETGFIYGAGNYSRGQVAILQAELHENVSFHRLEKPGRADCITAKPL